MTELLETPPEHTATCPARGLPYASIAGSCPACAWYEERTQDVMAQLEFNVLVTTRWWWQPCWGRG